MSTSAITGGFGELVIETEAIEVTSSSPRPDKDWRYTDQQGHEHYYWQPEPEPYPTLRRVVDATYWCAGCSDEHTDEHLECRLCGETITPGMVGPSMWREFVPGRTTYLLNGSPISEDEARRLVESMRS